MTTDHIDFISSYCDRWCERCGFTSRCATFAAEAAIAMCGDVEEGLELAVGTPAQVPAGPACAADPEWLREFDEPTISPEERRAIAREEDERRARVNDHPILKSAWTASMLAYQWLKSSATALRSAGDPVMNEALDVVTHDVFLVTVKLSRALDGRDRHEHEAGHHEVPVQNDWNGSAKVALICLTRSIAAWHVIAQAAGDSASLTVVEQMETLRRDVEQSFPNAYAFARPGFDDVD
jgi:hypothetical protein